MANVVLTKDTQKGTTKGSGKKLLAFKNLEKRLEELLNEEGPKSRVSFGFMVLSCVVQGNYERALTELDSTAMGIEGYPEFTEKSSRYIEHAKSLVLAIKTKKEIGLSPHINKSKQKELGDRIAEHFMDLKKCIIIIEKIEKGIRAKDLGSSVYIIISLYFSVVGLFVACLVAYLWPEIKDLPWDSIQEYFWPE